MDERNIIEQVLAGDNEAFGVLVERYQTKVYNLALRITGNEDDAADMAQEAFLRAWRSLKAFQFESSFSTWLFRLTHNVCIDHLRAKQRKPSISLTMQDDESTESVQLDLPGTDGAAHGSPGDPDDAGNQRYELSADRPGAASAGGHGQIQTLQGQSPAAKKTAGAGEQFRRPCV